MSVTKEIITVFKDFGNKDYIGEKITQIEHAIQAAMLAEKDGYGDEIIVAALLHDIGHLVQHKNTMDKWGAKHHEIIGAEYLKSLNFPELTINLVKDHVDTKRYLVTKNKEYYNSLSEASRNTLTYQGGSMNKEELYKFENKKHFTLNLKLRQWDDSAKIVDMKINEIEYYKPFIGRLFT